MGVDNDTSLETIMANSTTRKRVNKRQIGWDFYKGACMGPVYILRITYTDGRRSWAYSVPGSLGIMNRQDMNAMIRLDKADGSLRASPK